jgi:hypothetical protein
MCYKPENVTCAIIRHLRLEPQDAVMVWRSCRVCTMTYAAHYALFEGDTRYCLLDCLKENKGLERQARLLDHPLYPRNDVLACEDINPRYDDEKCPYCKARS